MTDGPFFAYRVLDKDRRSAGWYPMADRLIVRGPYIARNDALDAEADLIDSLEPKFNKKRGTRKRAA